MAKRLFLVPYESLVLREATNLVLDPKIKEIRNLVDDMIYSIRPEFLPEPAAGMAANQWGVNQQIFIYCPNGNDKDIQVIFNPTYEPMEGSEEEEGWEGCFSIPLALGKMRRHTKIKVTYVDKKGKFHSKILRDWEARVWQHETDHLRGFLYDMMGPRCCEKRIFDTEEEKELFLKQERQGES
ncbi:MAG: peptide deformylase [Gammaproteobacteria bacterium]